MLDLVLWRLMLIAQDARQAWHRAEGPAGPEAADLPSPACLEALEAETQLLCVATLLVYALDDRCAAALQLSLLVTIGSPHRVQQLQAGWRGQTSVHQVGRSTGEPCRGTWQLSLGML